MSATAHFVGAANGLSRYPTLQRRIKKFGAYWWAAVFFRSLLFKNPAYTHFRGNIIMKEIRPTQPKVIEVTANVLKILSDHAEKAGYDDIDVVGLQQKFQYSVEKNARPQKIIVFSHCELTLALHFYEKMVGSQHLWK